MKIGLTKTGPATNGKEAFKAKVGSTKIEVKMLTVRERKAIVITTSGRRDWDSARDHSETAIAIPVNAIADRNDKESRARFQNLAL